MSDGHRRARVRGAIKDRESSEKVRRQHPDVQRTRSPLAAAAAIELTF
jgi:hypothetical protein